MLLPSLQAVLGRTDENSYLRAVKVNPKSRDHKRTGHSSWVMYCLGVGEGRKNNFCISVT